MFARLISSLILLTVLSNDATAQRISQYVYMVRISGGSYSKAVLQTGFRLAGTKGIITCLHGVVAGSSFSALNAEGDVLAHLRLERVDIENDLALLLSDE